MIQKRIKQWIRSIASDEFDRRVTEKDFGIGDGTVSFGTEDDRIHISEAFPSVQFEGTEASAENFSVRENAGSFEKYDETNDQVDTAWDLSPPLENQSIDTLAASRDLQPEGQVTGLDATTTGVKYEGLMYQSMDEALVNDRRLMYIEAAKQSSAGDEDVTVEIYDGSTVLNSVTITGDSNRSRTSDISADVSPGDVVWVRWNVTAASGTTDATFDAVGARLVVE